MFRGTTPTARAGRPPKRRRRTSVVYAGGIAVVVLLAAVGLLLTGQLERLPRTSEPEPASEERAYRTPRGQRAVITLTDGTVARLNVGSTLVVLGGFGNSERAVRLEGEAFFEVVRDERLPFVVRTDQATVQVLGTSFNVHAYRKEPMHVAGSGRGAWPSAPGAVSRATPSRSGRARSLSWRTRRCRASSASPT